MNSLNNARLRAAIEEQEESSNYGITTYSHPIRSKENQIKGQTLEQHISDYAISLLMAIVLTFIPAANIIYLIDERKSEQKQIHRTFGVGPIKYWMAIMIWDILISLIFMSIAALILYVFQVRSFSANANLGASILLMLFYLLSSNSFIYIVEKLFSESSLGQIIILTCFIFTSLVTSITMLLLTMFWWIIPLQEAKKVLSTLFLIFPPYALSIFCKNFLSSYCLLIKMFQVGVS